MKAAVLTQLHHPVVYSDVPRPVAGAGEVVVGLKAAALNHRDIWIRKGLYPGVALPAILGSDGAGVVVEVGEPALGSWLDKRVVINPALNWGPETTHYGPDFRILGLEDSGTFAELIRIGVDSLVEMPEHLSFEEAAAIPLAGLTAWRSLLTKAAFTNGDKVLITGAGGGVSRFAIQFAVSMGAEVWVTSGSEEKIRRSVDLGARGGVNYKDPDWSKNLFSKVKAPRSGYFNVVIDSAGGAEFRKLTDLAAPGGRICFYGGTTGNITDLVPAKIFFKQLSILGSTMGTPGEFKNMMSFVSERKLRPVIDTVFPFDELESGFERMEQGEQFGKIVVTI